MSSSDGNQIHEIPHELRLLGERLQLLLNLSDKDHSAVLNFLGCLGCSDEEDLALIPKEDVTKNDSLSTVLKRKLHLIVSFVEKEGGSALHDVKSFTEIRKKMEPEVPQSNPATNTNESHRGRDGELIKLNVGGHQFTTTRNTICRVPDTFLSSMFSGRHENASLCLDDGSYFIDRDGSQFVHILNYLRVGDVVSLPKGEVEREMLVREADFYGLEGLVRAIQRPKLDLADPAILGEKLLAIWEEEERLRTLFREKQFSSIDAYQELLTPMFDFNRIPSALPIKYDPDARSSMPCVMDFYSRAEAAGEATTVTRLDQFLRNFNEAHANILSRILDILLEEPVIVAGGSVLRALTVGDKWQASDSDIDLFLYQTDPEAATRIARRIFYALAVDNERWVILRSKGVITIHNWRPNPWGLVVDQKIQIILRLYQSPAEVLYGFDVDCCCCAFDGRQVWVTSRCLEALSSRTNILNPIHTWPNRPSYELRLAKYAYRGYKVALPGLNTRRVDHGRIQKSVLNDLKGLARLLKISGLIEKNTSAIPPINPRWNEDLKEAFSNVMDSCKKLVETYDDEVTGIIAPSVYCGGDTSMWARWWYADESDFPLASDSRDEAWACIEDATDTESSVEHVPDRLLDAWTSDNQSREYLNAQMDKMDLDNNYYEHAYGTVA